MAKTKTEWYFIVNPHAGSGKSMSKWIPAEKKLSRLGIPHVTAYTDYKTHAISLARDAAADGYRKIVAVGGDGSLHEALGGIVTYCNQTGTPTEDFFLGVLPIGSGNDWIKCLDVPNDTSKVVDLIASDSFGTMDIVDVICNGGKKSVLANCGGVGFDSHVCKKVNVQKESGKRSKLIYLDGLLSTIFAIRPINVKILVDGKDLFCGPCFSMSLGNGKYSGGGMIQTPLADNDDGLLDIFVFPEQPVLPAAMELLPKIFNGKLIESNKVLFGRGKQIDIAPLDNDSSDIIEIDGEIVGRLPMTAKIEGRKINVIHG